MVAEEFEPSCGSNGGSELVANACEVAVLGGEFSACDRYRNRATILLATWPIDRIYLSVLHFYYQRFDQDGLFTG